MTDYNVALRAAERAGQVSACRICKVPLVSGQEGAHFRQWLFCNDCYHNTVGSDEVPCEGYEGECNVDGWVYHNKSYIDNRHYASYRGPHSEQRFSGFLNMAYAAKRKIKTTPKSPQTRLATLFSWYLSQLRIVHCSKPIDKSLVTVVFLPFEY